MYLLTTCGLTSCVTFLTWIRGITSFSRAESSSLMIESASEDWHIIYNLNSTGSYWFVTGQNLLKLKVRFWLLINWGDIFKAHSASLCLSDMTTPVVCCNTWNNLCWPFFKKTLVLHSGALCHWFCGQVIHFSLGQSGDWWSVYDNCTNYRLRLMV